LDDTPHRHAASHTTHPTIPTASPSSVATAAHARSEREGGRVTGSPGRRSCLPRRGAPVRTSRSPCVRTVWCRTRRAPTPSGCGVRTGRSSGYGRGGQKARHLFPPLVAGGERDIHADDGRDGVAVVAVLLVLAASRHIAGEGERRPAVAVHHHVDPYRFSLHFSSPFSSRAGEEGAPVPRHLLHSRHLCPPSRLHPRHSCPSPPHSPHFPVSAS